MLTKGRGVVIFKQMMTASENGIDLPFYKREYC